MNAPGTHQPERTETPGLVEPRTPPEGEMEWVYLWHWPIRAMHWAAALSIVVLAVTGLYIGKPYFLVPGDASSAYLMGWMRFLHFAAAGLLVATGIVRIYWLFAGNRYERFGALFPVKPKDWKNMWEQTKHYLMMAPREAPAYLGHNPLQQLSYTGIYVVAALMVVTGFALYGQANPGGFFYATFGWVTGLFGHIQTVRFVHHLLTWVFLIFIPIHVYLSMRADLLENTGTISSIISGGRYVPVDKTFEDE